MRVMSALMRLEPRRDPRWYVREQQGAEEEREREKGSRIQRTRERVRLNSRWRESKAAGNKSAE